MDRLEYKLLAILPNNNDSKLFTLYLFNYKEKILIPVKINKWSCDSILLAKQNLPFARPHVHNSYMRTIKALGADLEGVLVYKYIDDIFYSYLLLKKDENSLEVDIKFTDALCLSLLFNKPLLIETAVALDSGIKVTKELLEKSLEFEI